MYFRFENNQSLNTESVATVYFHQVYTPEIIETHLYKH